MKKINKILTIFCIVLMVCCVSLFAGCQKDDADKPAASPSGTPKTTAAIATSPVTTAPATATSTPEATAAPTSNEKNLLDFAIEEDPLLLGGDSWVPIEEVWAGPLQEVRDGCESPAKQEFVDETLSNGEEGTCYHFYSEAETGYHIVGNTFGITDLVEANKTYKLTVSLKYTVPNPGAERDNMGVGCNVGEAPAVKVPSSSEWQTVTYTFTVGENFETVYIYVSPIDHPHEIVIGDIQAGFDLLIESISLVEVQ